MTGGADDRLRGALLEEGAAWSARMPPDLVRSMVLGKIRRRRRTHAIGLAAGAAALVFVLALSRAGIAGSTTTLDVPSARSADPAAGAPAHPGTVGPVPSEPPTEALALGGRGGGAQGRSAMGGGAALAPSTAGGAVAGPGATHAGHRQGGQMPLRTVPPGGGQSAGAGGDVGGGSGGASPSGGPPGTAPTSTLPPQAGQSPPTTGPAAPGTTLPAPPASISPPTTLPTSAISVPAPAGTYTFTNQDLGTTQDVPVGALILLRLTACPGARWQPPQSSAPAVVAPRADVAVGGPGVVASLRAVGDGTADVRVDLESVCAISGSFEITFVVT